MIIMLNFRLLKLKAFPEYSRLRIYQSLIYYSYIVLLFHISATNFNILE